MRAAQQAELPFQPSQLPVSLPQRCAGPGLPSGPPPAQQQCKCHVWIKQSKGCQSDMAYHSDRSRDLLRCSQLRRSFSQAVSFTMIVKENAELFKSFLNVSHEPRRV